MVNLERTQQRKSWSREKKIEIVKYAHQNNDYQASKHFGVDRKSNRQWRERIEEIRGQRIGSRGNRRADENNPILEVKLCKKYYERKRQGQKCTEKWVRKTARHMMSRSEGSFSASPCMTYKIYWALPIEILSELR